MSKGSVLITGGAGFIGTNLSIMLINEGYHVTVLDKLLNQVHGTNVFDSYLLNKIVGKVDFICGDVCDLDLMKVHIPKYDYIVHLAAETGTGQSMYQIDRYTKTNILGCSNIVEVLTNEKHSVKKVLYASTRAVYGEGKYKCSEHGFVYPASRKEKDMLNRDFECKCPVCGSDVKIIPTDENSNTSVVSLYGITKLSGEQILLNQCYSLGIPFVGLRLQNVYGEGQSLKNPYTGILSIFSNLLLNNKPINIFEDGFESRDFVHVYDVASAFLSALSNESIFSDIINIGSGVGITVLDVSTLLKNYYKSESQLIITGDFRKGDIRHNVANVEKAKKILNWETTVLFSEGLKCFTEWVQTQNLSYINSAYTKSLDEMHGKGLFIKGRSESI